MSPQEHRHDHHRKLKELLARRAAVRRGIRVIDLKIAALSSAAVLMRRGW